ncbi:hypothetical protein SAMN05444416_10993 [Thermoactinomyces sp. DSM 45892]|nr:hypothetical protein SAMN05444416_10993 [Thermoactinomyces sp. DSM 45892]
MWTFPSNLKGVYSKRGIITTYICNNLVYLYITDGEPDIPLGTEVYIHVRRFFYYETEQEYTDRLEQEARRKKATEEEEKQAKIRRAERSRKVRTEAEEFNASLKIPVLWTSGIKDVLSGLSANSWGDGRKSSTVEHILLLEDINEGRFKRLKGDFLCTTSKGSNGRNWSGSKEETRTDDDGITYVPKITCRACLKVAARWQMN